MDRHMNSTTADIVIEELRRRGFELAAVDDRLRLRPGQAVTPTLQDVLRRHKKDLLDAIREDLKQSAASSSTPITGPLVHYSDIELVLLGDGPEQLWEVVDEIKKTFADVGEVEVHRVDADPKWWRAKVAELIKTARRRGDREEAKSLRDRARERAAVVAVDGGCSEGQGWALAYEDLDRLVTHESGRAAGRSAVATST